MTDTKADLKEVFKRLSEAYRKRVLREAVHDETGEVVMHKLPKSAFGEAKE